MTAAPPDGEIAAQLVQPIKITGTYEPVEMTELEEGVCVFDIGEQLAGWGELTVEGRGYEHKISITGDQDDPSNCPVGSIVVAGVNGGIVSVDGVEFQHANPHSNDANGFSAFYTNQARLHNCAFTGRQNGVMSYGSNLEIHQVDFGEASSTATQSP